MDMKQAYQLLETLRTERQMICRRPVQKMVPPAMSAQAPRRHLKRPQKPKPPLLPAALPISAG
jgi:hypothetical protein